jgi:putative transposase
MTNHKLAGAIAELGWYEFRRQLSYKCERYGSELRVISQWTPSSKLHHQCDYKNKGLTLKDRVFYCPKCQESLDRDLNAALNIERFGLSLSSWRSVDREVPSPLVEADRTHFVLANVSVLGAVLLTMGYHAISHSVQSSRIFWQLEILRQDRINPSVAESEYCHVPRSHWFRSQR